jgi:hypothetical protein
MYLKYLLYIPLGIKRKNVVQRYVDNQSFENGQNGDILLCLKF